ncbi:MAG: hypothetical protein KBF45_05175 [Cyclobacteriaceae bacterium]|jgi:hypothetical protein|nr:hypothetical protein [Cyclobacteriaceae bacterium]
MKISEEYMYKNSLSEKPQTIILSDYSITIKSESNEKVIPYANILSVRLSKRKGIYSAVIQPDGQGPIIVTNQFYLSSHEREDRSRQYATFIKVLHFHLREKSVAIFTCGNNLGNLLIGACVAVVLAFIISFGLDLLNVSPINSNILAVMLSALSVSLIVAANWKNFPNIYRPENIPLQFLPGV